MIILFAYIIEFTEDILNSLYEMVPWGVFGYLVPNKNIKGLTADEKIKRLALFALYDTRFASAVNQKKWNIVMRFLLRENYSKHLVEEVNTIYNGELHLVERINVIYAGEQTLLDIFIASNGGSVEAMLSRTGNTADNMKQMYSLLYGCGARVFEELMIFHNFYDEDLKQENSLNEQPLGRESADDNTNDIHSLNFMKHCNSFITDGCNIGNNSFRDTSPQDIGYVEYNSFPEYENATATDYIASQIRKMAKSKYWG